MYTLKSIAQRGTILGVAASLFVAAVMPAASVFAQVALNPLTERSLLLSSSAPGWQDTDGSGYSEDNPNPATGVNGTPDHYAPAGSGPNGKKTGETFSFKTSTTADIKGFSFQYCMTAAGQCQAPGNNTGDFDPDDDGDGSDSTRLLNETPTTGGWANEMSDLNVVGTFTNTASGVTPAAGEFVVLVDTGSGFAESTGWTMSAINAESEDLGIEDLDLTGKNNMIYLTNATGGQIPAGAAVKIQFQPSETVFITNPGDRSFFVKINTYNTENTALFVPTVPYESNPNIVDGGVTVANVMTDSIHITTKVLETMAFSVGTQNRDTVAGPHGTCDAINQVNNNRLQLGNPSAEYSLETGKAYDVYSYWRLSSNSSGGASVYYSGNTLANTVGDEIADMPSEAVSNPGTEQFGLGFVDAGLDTFDPVFSNGVDGYVETNPAYNIPRSYPFITLSSQTGSPYDTLAAQTASVDYDEATGTIDDGNSQPGTAKFKFLKSSLTVPELIAAQSEAVISCATAKMRYVANIAADTPAGVYTTKINYLAAPQY